MLNGLDLFSGIGGISEALAPWVKTVAYCERERYPQGVLLSRMAEGQIDVAPIWDDVTTLKKKHLPEIDIITGGFPCQDISSAGRGAGLGGERSGLFFEIMRLAKEIKPQLIFLENVSAIRLRGLDRVGQELANLGYDCRWGVVSAFDVGAPHLRKRWFCLAHVINARKRGQPRKKEVAKTSGDFGNQRLEKQQGFKQRETYGHIGTSSLNRRTAWTIEPNVGRVVHGLPMRCDRIKALGNSVVPQCAREAFQRLMGFKGKYMSGRLSDAQIDAWVEMEET